MIKRLSAANDSLTAAVTKLGAEITKRGRAGQRIFLPGDRVLLGMEEALRSFELELELVVQEAEDCDAPPGLKTIHSGLLEAFRDQFNGVIRAREGVKNADFAEVGIGLELREKGIKAMQEKAEKLRRSISRRRPQHL